MVYAKPIAYFMEESKWVSPVVWWVVPLAILAGLAAVIAAAVILWCAIHGNGVVVSWYLVWGWLPSAHIACSQ